MSVTAEAMLVSPELAKEWLRQNTSNRRPSEKVVERYSRDMAAGRWIFNGEAVKIASSGKILDGQQRLMAVVKADTEVLMMVVMGLDETTQASMDQGRARTVADNLTIAGEPNASILASLGRRVWQWDQGNDRFTNHVTPTKAEVVATIQKYPSLRRSAEIGGRTANTYRVAPASVVGTAHHILSPIAPGIAAEFFAQYETGADLRPGHPVLALRNRLSRDKLASKNVPFHLAVALFIRAWNGVVEDRLMDRLVHTAEENMPEISRP